METFKKIIAVGALLGVSVAQAFMPQTGTWVVTSENNGQPGRGFGIDVQNSTLVMQMYGYETNGSPTFYLSAGAIADNKFTAPLNTYKGGRYLGSGDRSGTQTGTAGNVSMRFVSGTKGYITFPNEAEKEISRFNFAYTPTPSSLKGIWLFSPLNSTTPLADFVALSTVGTASAHGNGLVLSDDGRFACEHQISGEAVGTVICIRVTSAGKLAWGYQFTVSVNDGEGKFISGTGGDTELAIARRLTNPAGTATGVLLKSETARQPAQLTEATVDSLRAGIESVANSGLTTD
ncbi:hypothetical protein [Diaphorobacter aerolatus]|uniref:Uncharacterized protein n=1 Tax=Diaphorobacter aerolatus TaxID=1288495 RepID=A0A7H0GL46_9BURK|nr:hypothetical protein [Diaphorobacter aerolatus]QNP49012.1 hypothetical protein H9K75_02245 [Diaphorobacter aerolatus]